MSDKEQPMTEQIEVGGVVHRVEVDNQGNQTRFKLNGVHFATSDTYSTVNVPSLCAAIRAATPKEPDVKQEFKVGDRVRIKGTNEEFILRADVGIKHVWLAEDKREPGFITSAFRIEAIPLSPPDPYEAAADQIVSWSPDALGGCEANIADILRSHFPAYAEMRAVVEAARSCRNFMDPDDYTDLQDALDALAAKEAGRG